VTIFALEFFGMIVASRFGTVYISTPHHNGKILGERTAQHRPVTVFPRPQLGWTIAVEKVRFAGEPGKQGHDISLGLTGGPDGNLEVL
jgi:hypothetical protein